MPLTVCHNAAAIALDLISSYEYKNAENSVNMKGVEPWIIAKLRNMHSCEKKKQGAIVMAGCPVIGVPGARRHEHDGVIAGQDPASSELKRHNPGDNRAMDTANGIECTRINHNV
jgi:hypothetical protein